MKPRVHLLLCLLALPLALWLAYWLDRWILVGAGRSNLLMDGSFARAKAYSRIAIALLLLVLSWLVLHRRPSLITASSYLFVGAFLAFTPPLALSGFTFAALLFLPSLQLLATAPDIFPFACASLFAIGVAAFFRRYAIPESGNAS